MEVKIFYFWGKGYGTKVEMFGAEFLHLFLNFKSNLFRYFEQLTPNNVPTG